MAKNSIFGIRNINLLLILFIFVLLFILPIIFTRTGDAICWRNVLKIWQDRAPLIPLFVLNHWVLVPKLILLKRYKAYLGMIAMIIILITAGCYINDDTDKRSARQLPKPEPGKDMFINDHKKPKPVSHTPSPIPPYANLLTFSLLLVAVDTGLSFTKHWHKNEEDKIELEKENSQAQLEILRNQISPHFFMNTLNNIYSLVDSDAPKAKKSVMKLSKLMRYMLYENSNGKVLLSKEFEFITSFVDLMRLRFTDQVSIVLIIPDKFEDIKIPVMLFNSYIENAFKYGASYQQNSFVNIVFDISRSNLVFNCTNSTNLSNESILKSCTNLEANKHRLDLLYKNNYSIATELTDKIFNIKLTIPLILSGTFCQHQSKREHYKKAYSLSFKFAFFLQSFPQTHNFKII